MARRDNARCVLSLFLADHGDTAQPSDRRQVQALDVLAAHKGEHPLLELGRIRPAGVHPADDRPDARSGDDINGNAGALQRLEHPDLRQATPAAARKG